jgi:poly(3-hydroxyalkanoate) depolymerase
MKTNASGSKAAAEDAISAPQPDPPQPDPPQPADARRRSTLRAVTDGRRQNRDAAEQMRTLTVRGRALRVCVREGDPQRPPLLLCNGIGASLELLQPFVDALDPKRGVIRFDLPGTGGSALPLLPYHMTTLASMLSGLLDQLGHTQADVLGISWGGGLAQQFALQYPARVRRLVLAATATGALMVPGHPGVLIRMLTPRRHHDAGYAARIAGGLYGGGVRADPARAADLLHASTRPGLSWGYFYQLLAIAGWTSLPLLPLLRQPTLILAGDDDPIIPLINAQIMHRMIARSELTVYRGGHLDLLLEAKRMAPIVEAFLDAETGSAADSAATAAPSPPIGEPLTGT